MNVYTELLRYIETLANEDSYVNTITRSDNFDDHKSTVYPLLDVEVNAGSFTNGNTIIFNVVLTCLDIRDINKTPETDRYMKGDNEVDNHNNTLAFLSRLWNKMYLDLADRNITSSENPSFEKMTGVDKNVLDGWSLSFDVELPNTTIVLCDA